jgi:hypothetical protein
MTDSVKIQYNYPADGEYICGICGSPMVTATCDDEHSTVGLRCSNSECDRYDSVVDVPHEIISVEVLGVPA